MQPCPQLKLQLLETVLDLWHQKRLHSYRRTIDSSKNLSLKEVFTLYGRQKHCLGHNWTFKYYNHSTSFFKGKIILFASAISFVAISDSHCGMKVLTQQFSLLFKDLFSPIGRQKHCFDLNWKTLQKTKAVPWSQINF